MEEQKFCKFCGEKINNSCIVCPKCGRQLEVISQVASTEQLEQKPNPILPEQEKPKFYSQEWFMWLMLVACAPIGILLMFKFNKRLTTKIKVIIAVIFGLLFLLFNFIPSDSDSNDMENSNLNNNSSVENNQNNAPAKKSYSFNDTFEFDDLEITIGSNYTFTTVEYSDYYQKTIVKLPITVKNIKDETHSLNMFYYSIFGSAGTEVTNVWTYFDDSVESAEDLRTNASYTKYLYFIYDGNGTYAIEFYDYWNEKLVEIVEIEINK